MTLESKDKVAYVHVNKACLRLGTPPTLEKLKGHIALDLSVRPSVRPSISPFKIY